MQWTEFSFILQPSKLGGVGVFATHAIPSGTRVFSGNFSPRKMKITEVPEAFKKFCVYINESECLCPERFDRMEIGWYLNHSHEPNIRKLADSHVVAVRDIKPGDEILMDYNDLHEPDNMKEDYYKKP